MRCSISILVVAFAGFSSAGAQQPTTRDTRAMEDTLQQFAIRVERAMQLANADSILTLYGRPDVFVNIEDGEPVPHARMEQEIRDYASDVASSPVRWLERPVVIVLNRDAAVLYGRHRFEGLPGIPAHTGIWTAVLQRIDGQWRIVHAHGSDVPEPVSGRE